jgi:RimJ/RimL family protein N-acetyltransferase
MTASPRITLVPLDRTHMARTQAWANDPDTARLMNRVNPVSDAEHETWFQSILIRPDCAYFAIEQSGAQSDAPTDQPHHIGNVWLWDIDMRHHKAELRVVVGEPAARGRCIGAEAIDLLCRHGFEHLNLHRIYAYVLAINPGARRSFENAGFRLEGTLRDDRWSVDGYVDTWLLGRLKE